MSVASHSQSNCDTGRHSGSAACFTYVYAVSRTCDPTVLEQVRGHTDGGPLRLLSVGELTAVVQDVPTTAFSEDALRRRLAEREELERCARVHHEVVTAASAHGAVVPLPLATLYRDEVRALAALSESTRRFGRALDRVEGHAEWAVKVHAVSRPEGNTSAGSPPRPTTAVPEDGSMDSSGRSPGSAPPAGSGRAYLSRARGRQRAWEQRFDAALEVAEQVDRILRTCAAASVRRRLHSAEVTGKERRQVMNAAYLVTKGREVELTAAIESLRRQAALQDVEIDVSGPWVPYSFTEGGDENDQY
ncbi:GvpL/GvpF family gas vesicle protein [Streptomyces sp. NPDC002346]